MVDPCVDPETGLQYLRARYYDPATGQFLTRDPLDMLTRQAYTYTQDNPVNGTDPMGLCGFGSIGDFFDCVNPTSSGNIAYQGATALSNATGGAINLPWLLTRPAVVDAGAVATCATPFLDAGCVPAMAAAWSECTSAVVATGIETHWCDPGRLAAEETINTLFLGFGGLGKYAADAAAEQGATALGRVAIRVGPLLAQGGLDLAIELTGGF